MQTTSRSYRRNIAHVLAGLGTFALMAAVCAGCGLAASTEATEAGQGTDSEGNDEFVLPSKPKRTCVELIAGQTIHAGTVCMTIEPHGVMNVLYTTTGGWQLIEAQLAAGDSMSDVPLDHEGNPMIGQFAFDSGDITGATSHAFVVPLLNFRFNGDFNDTSESCDSVTAYLAAHAILRKRGDDGTWQTESGWGNREGINDSGNWVTFFNMSLQCGAHESPQLEICENAFAKGGVSTCFIGSDFDGDEHDDGIEHWGWTNGPIAPGTGAAWPVYAAAGQCDLARATRVGSLSVSYGRDGNAQIVFDRVGDFVLDEEHLHVGTEPLPRGSDDRSTVAPARYPIVRELDDATHTENLVGGLQGDIYVAYHAIACVPDRGPTRRAAR
jgi:hypothetical protein